MFSYLRFPYYFVRFWFIEAPSGMLDFFLSLNHAFFHFFSLPLFLRTFFQPLKNEYRTGLVGFSIGMGIAVKTVLILVDILLFIILLIFEAAVLVSFVVFPFLTIALLIW